MLPFELFVFATPRSRQTRDRGKRRDWKARIREEAIDLMDQDDLPVRGPIRVRIGYYFHRASLDVDNIVKAILDGLERVVYENDNSVTDLVVSKRSVDEVAGNENASMRFARALQGGADFLHIVVDPPVGIEVLR